MWLLCISNVFLDYFVNYVAKKCPSLKAPWGAGTLPAPPPPLESTPVSKLMKSIYVYFIFYLPSIYIQGI